MVAPLADPRLATQWSMEGTIMAIFKRKKKQAARTEDDEPQPFSHASGGEDLGDVLDQHGPKYDEDNPPSRPRGRSARLHPEGDPEKNPFERR